MRRPRAHLHREPNKYLTGCIILLIETTARELWLEMVVQYVAVKREELVPSKQIFAGRFLDRCGLFYAHSARGEQKRFRSDDANRTRPVIRFRNVIRF